MMGILNDARLRAGAMMREWNEKRAEQKAIKEQSRAASQLHGHSRFWLLNVPAIATILAAITEWYWALLFCIEATGHIDWNFQTASGSSTPLSSVWNFAFEGHLVVLIGLIAATAPIVMISMIWLPVQFAMRGFGRWRRGTMIAVGVLANILVIVSGTVVMNHNRQDQVRDAVVVEQTAAQGRAAIDARLAFEQEQLRLALTNTNPYLNQAASVGAAEWERSYVAQARATNDPRLPQLERALGAARAADERRANIERLTIERATAAPEAASAANVTDTVGAELNTFAQQVEVWRPPFIAVLCTLIGIFGAWWTIAMLEHMNPKDVLRSGWAPEELRIEDHSKEAPVAAESPIPTRKRRKVYNAETGREEAWVDGHYRATGKKKKNPDGTEGELMEFAPDIPKSEKGVSVDGGGRIGASVAGPIDVAAIVENSRNDNPLGQANQNNSAELAEQSQADPVGDESRGAANAEPQGAGNSEPQTTPPTEPEPEIDWATLVEEPEQTQPEADSPEPTQSVEQDNAERDDVEPRGLLPAA